LKRLIIGGGKVSDVIRRVDDVVVSHSICDIRNIKNIEEIVLKTKPHVIINCAAITNLEYCQDNKVEAFETNARGVANVINVCADKKIKLIHISSGCFHDGNKVVSNELSHPTPRVWYTWTKLWADQYVQNFGYSDYLILRPRQLFSRIPHKSNLITKFSLMNVINAIKEDNSATCIEDFGKMIDHLIKTEATGVFNCVNEGVLSPYDMAIEIKNRMCKNLEVNEISYEALLDILKNVRVNNILSTEKLRSTNFNIRDVREAFIDCVTNYGK